jgi:hypothetical protein
MELAQKLSRFELWSRARARAAEREGAAASRIAEREHTATVRTAEREAIRTERAAERMQLRREEEQEREAEKQAKAREKLVTLMAKEAQLQAWQDEAEEHERFMGELVAIHNMKISFSASQAAFRKRQVPRTFTSKTFTPRAEPLPPEIPPFEPQSLTIPPLESTPRFLDDWSQRLANRAVLFAFLAVLLVAGFGPALVATVAALAGVWWFRKKRMGEVLLPAHEAMAQQLQIDFAEANRIRREAYDRRSDDLKVQFIVAKREYGSRERDRRASFDANEAQNAAQFEANELRRLELLAQAKKGDAEALFSIMSAGLPVEFELDFPSNHEGATLAQCSVGLAAEPGGIRIYLRLPDSSIVPAKAISMTANGKAQKTTTIAESQRSLIYTEFAQSICLSYAAIACNLCPSLAKVTVEGAIQTNDPATGQPTEHRLVCFKTTYEQIASLQLDSVSPEAFIESVEGTTSVLTKRSKIVALSEPKGGISWLDEGSDTLMLPFGLVKGEEKWQWTNPDA